MPDYLPGRFYGFFLKGNQFKLMHQPVAGKIDLLRIARSRRKKPTKRQIIYNIIKMLLSNILTPGSIKITML